MRWRPALAVLLLGGLLATAPARAEEAVGEPVKLVRTLQFLQDEIAAGEAESGEARRRMIALVGQRFLEADASTWRDRRNIDAALLYVLNGGNPAVLARLRPADEDAALKGLIAAVSAYSRGSRAEAETLWSGIDIGGLPIGLAGPAALVKANLLIDSDPAQALRFADVARLESPGTLVEEAAIRRSIEIAAKLHDAGKFQFYAVRYATRFPRSTYERAFRERFAASYLDFAGKAQGGPVPQLEEILAPLDDADRRQIYLDVARRAVIEVRMDLARDAAEKALALSAASSNDRRRAELYRAAAQAISANPGDASRVLRTMPPAALEPVDRDIRAALLLLLDRMRDWPGASEGSGLIVAEAAATEAQPEIGEIAAQARSAMEAAAAAIRELDP